MNHKIFIFPQAIFHNIFSLQSFYFIWIMKKMENETLLTVTFSHYSIQIYFTFSVREIKYLSVVYLMQTFFFVTYLFEESRDFSCVIFVLVLSRILMGLRRIRASKIPWLFDNFMTRFAEQQVDIFFVWEPRKWCHLNI
jgi:hypothetical protein